MSTSSTTANASEESGFRWLLLVLTLAIAASSAHETLTKYLTTAGTRIGFLVGIAAAAVAWALILRHEEGYLRKAREALPYAEFRHHPGPAAGVLCRSLLFRWSLLVCVSVLGVEHVLEVLDLRPSIGPSIGLTALALATTGEAVRRGVLSTRGQTTETPDLPAAPNIALSQPVRFYGSMVLAWGFWIFACLVVVTGCLKLLERW